MFRRRPNFCRASGRSQRSRQPRIREKVGFLIFDCFACVNKNPASKHRAERLGVNLRRALRREEKKDGALQFTASADARIILGSRAYVSSAYSPPGQLGLAVLGELHLSFEKTFNNSISTGAFTTLNPGDTANVPLVIDQAEFALTPALGAWWCRSKT